MDRLSADYIRGYTDGLVAVREALAYLTGDMKRHHMTMNRKNATALISCMIENRATLRDWPESFVRCNNGKFEVYNPVAAGREDAR